MMHEDRRRAESFGGDADRYDRSRPTYPPELIDAVLDPDPGPLDVLDVGCGTGIASRLLAGRGARVLGVEIDPRMAERARAGGTRVEVGRFEEWDPAGRRFDRVTSAQAWHWVDPVAGAAKAASVLRPGGRLCLWWNMAEPPTDLAAALNDTYDLVAPGTDGYSLLLGHRHHANEGVAALEGLQACPELEEPVVSAFEWRRTYTREEWLDQLPTHSDHAALPRPELQQLLDAIGDVIDRFGGSFEMTYFARLISAGMRAA